MEKYARAFPALARGTSGLGYFSAATLVLSLFPKNNLLTIFLPRPSLKNDLDTHSNTKFRVVSKVFLYKQTFNFLQNFYYLNFFWTLFNLTILELVLTSQNKKIKYLKTFKSIIYIVPLQKKIANSCGENKNKDKETEIRLFNPRTGPKHEK